MDTKFQPPVQLSEVQAQVLMLVMFAGTPAMAADTLSSNDKAAASAEILMQRGLVNNGGGQAHITDKGMEMLDKMNIIDKQGQRTQYGEELYTKAVKLYNAESSAYESAWPLISSASQRV